MPRRSVLLTSALCCAALTAAAQQPPAQAPTTNLGPDANGNPRRLAVKTGHVSNYDEAKVRPYTLPDPLVLSNGKPVRDSKTWQRERRPEIIRMYEAEIFGRVPVGAPKVTWRVTQTDPAAREGTVAIKRVQGTIGAGPDAPQIPLTLYTPANARRRVPVILLVNFGGGRGSAPAAGLPAGEPPVAAEILARGWGYATAAYQDIQPDRATSLHEAVIALARPEGQPPAPGDWGAIGAWAGGASRALDYLQTDLSVQ